MSRSSGHDVAGGNGRQPDWREPLRFASGKFLMRLTGGHCPCHPDKKPSFSAKPGREPGTTIVACGAGCSQDELLTHFRKLGYRLGPMRMVPPKRPKQVERPASVNTSVAFRALTPSERRMHDIIATGANPTYEDFVAAGISRSALSVGIRALQALGFIGVRRSPRRKGCLQYEQNQYWLEGGWQRWQPQTTSKAAKQAALMVARTAAKAARKGGEDISAPTEKPETGDVDLRVSEVRVRGSDSGTESYVVRTLASMSQESSRPALVDEGHRLKSDVGKAVPAAMPPRQSGDPGPMSEDGYGAGPPDRSQGFIPIPASYRFNPPCRGLACGKEGECLHPGSCRSGEPPP
jgi:hypothetical protein